MLGCIFKNTHSFLTTEINFTFIMIITAVISTNLFCVFYLTWFYFLAFTFLLFEFFWILFFPLLFHSLYNLFLFLNMWRISMQCRRPRFDPWVGKIPWRREWQPTPVFLPGESMDRGSWWATVHRVANSQTLLID